MSIDKSGQLWKGADAGDLDEFLPAFAGGGYVVDRVVHSRCGCAAEPCSRFASMTGGIRRPALRPLRPFLADARQR